MVLDDVIKLLRTYSQWKKKQYLKRTQVFERILWDLQFNFTV